MQVYLINILFFCLILLVLALTVGALQMVLILIDVRKTSSEISSKVRMVASLFDIVTMLVGGMGTAKRKMNDSSLAAFAAGLKKSFEVLFKK
jgi:hypothetical protein